MMALLTPNGHQDFNTPCHNTFSEININEMSTLEGQFLFIRLVWVFWMTGIAEAKEAVEASYYIRFQRRDVTQN